VLRERLPSSAHHQAVRDFRLAAERRDMQRLASLLDPDVAVVVDSGGTKNPTTVRMVRGTYDAIALLVLGLGQQPGVSVSERSVSGQAGLMVSRHGEVTAAITIDFRGPLLSVVWIRLQPEVLRHWNSV
jgi:hypothetical protein